MEINLQFVNQHIRKDIEHDCGVAGAMMLLNRYKTGNPDFLVPDFNQLAIMLWADIPPEMKGYLSEWGYGAYVTDIYRAFDGMRLSTDSCIGLSSKLATEKGDYALKCDKMCESCGSCKRPNKNKIEALKKLLQKKYPVMVGICDFQISGTDEGHWIVIIGYDKEGFIYLDPWLKVKRRKMIEFQKFHEKWDQSYIAIVN